MSHLMADGRPCELPDGHNGCHRSVGYKERRRAYYEYRRAYYEANREKELARQSDYWYERMPFKVRAMKQMRDRRRKGLQRIAARNERYGAPSQADLDFEDFIAQSLKGVQ